MSTLRDWFSLVRFSHSVFALPFALCGAWLAGGGRPSWSALAAIVICAVAARTAAMAFNRLVDRRIDAENPRTRAREIPAGRVRVGEVRLLIALASAAFVACAFTLNTLSGWLTFPVLAWLFAYSYFKRFSALAHFALGGALALAPLGAWIAVRGQIDGDLAPVLWLALAVLTWVAGFDLIYACQDVDFDRRAGLYSIPARYGVGAALAASAASHAVTVASLAMVGVSADLGWIYWLALVLATAMLVWEHAIVRPSDLSRVDTAFFTINGWIGIGLFLGVALDRGLLAG